MRRLTMAWKGLAASEAANITRLCGEESVFIRYPDPYTGLARSGEFYVSEIKVSYVKSGTQTLVGVKIKAEEV